MSLLVLLLVRRRLQTRIAGTQWKTSDQLHRLGFRWSLRQGLRFAHEARVGGTAKWEITFGPGGVDPASDRQMLGVMGIGDVRLPLEHHIKTLAATGGRKMRERWSTFNRARICLVERGTKHRDGILTIFPII